MAKKKTTAKSRKKKRSKTEIRRKRMLWLLYLFLIPAAIGLILTVIPQKPKQTGPRFQKEGQLEFLDAQNNQVIKQIEIEVARDEIEIQQGLMWRRAMEKNRGMLFLMPIEEPQSFWMLNTYIALDIIFVNQEMEIVKIQAERQPQSLQSIPSEHPAIYVVEVNAGFCAENGIEEGDLIRFQLLE